jgi:hypothetical protein
MRVQKNQVDGHLGTPRCKRCKACKARCKVHLCRYRHCLCYSITPSHLEMLKRRRGTVDMSFHFFANQEVLQRCKGVRILSVYRVKQLKTPYSLPYISLHPLHLDWSDTTSPIKSAALLRTALFCRVRDTDGRHRPTMTAPPSPHHRIGTRRRPFPPRRPPPPLVPLLQACLSREIRLWSFEPLYPLSGHESRIGGTHAAIKTKPTTLCSTNRNARITGSVGLEPMGGSSQANGGIFSANRGLFSSVWGAYFGALVGVL